MSVTRQVTKFVGLSNEAQITNRSHTAHAPLVTRLVCASDRYKTHVRLRLRYIRVRLREKSTFTTSPELGSHALSTRPQQHAARGSHLSRVQSTPRHTQSHDLSRDVPA